MEVDSYENKTTAKMSLATPAIITFDCFKSYEESAAYLKGENAIRFGYLYHYATLRFNDTSQPTPSMDSNYYNIPEPIEASCGDVWSTSTDILINEYRLRTKVEAILEKNDALLTDKFLLSLGFVSVNMSMIFGKGVKVTKPW